MLASLFILSGCMKLANHEETGEGPVVAYMQPKLDYFLEQVQQHTGFHVPLEKVLLVTVWQGQSSVI